ncbi:MAG TPA: metallophosphoesterase family protein [Polyangiaceae bacterium]|nr:metallophosphoesterase family protein [Polyangiaceae bacterium]
MQIIRRVGLIGDVHAEDEALAFVLDELKKLGAETLLQVGDIADGPGDLARSVGLLKEHHVLAVRGNHDRWLLGNQFRELPNAQALAAVPSPVVDFLTELPVTRQFRSPRGHVLLCHGLGSNDMVSVKPDHEGYDIASNTELQRLISERRYRFVLNGHTHRSMLRTFGPLSIVNAGTLLRDYERCFTLVDFERGELLRFRHAAGALTYDRERWFEDHQVLADSPSEPFREPFV